MIGRENRAGGREVNVTVPRRHVNQTPWSRRAAVPGKIEGPEGGWRGATPGIGQRGADPGRNRVVCVRATRITTRRTEERTAWGRTGLGALRSLVLLAGWLALPAAAAVEEPVVLRTPQGAFLREDASGEIRADRLYPTEGAVFQVVRQADDRLALMSASGRYLAFDPARGAWRTVPGADGPGPRHLLRLVTDEDGRTRLAGATAPGTETAGGEGEHGSGGPPADAATLEIYRFSQLAPAVCSALSLALSSLVADQLADRVYDKVRWRRKVKYVELPAPTLNDWRRKKKHRLLSFREEYRVQAQLAGSPTIQISGMPCLRGLGGSGPVILLFVVEAGLPVRGRVRYQIPGTLSLSTGYEATAELALVGELRAEVPQEGGIRAEPRVRRVRVQLRGLDLSNDLLSAARALIEDLINRELGRNRDRIIREANRAIGEAIRDDGFRDRLGPYFVAP